MSDPVIPAAMPILSMQSESVKNLAAALCRALPEIPEIEKNQTATIRPKPGDSWKAYQYKYADLGAILSATTKPLAKEGLVVVWPSTPVENTVILTATMMHSESGEFLKAAMRLPVCGNMKDLGSAITYIKRYLYLLLVPVVAEADDDGQRADKGADDDETAQAALLEAKRKEREDALAKKDPAFKSRRTPVAPIEEAAVTKPAETTSVAAKPEPPVQTAAAEPTPPPPPELPPHLQALQMMLDEAGITREKFMAWITGPRKNADGTPKGRLLPEGTKFDDFGASAVKDLTQPAKWAKVLTYLK